MSSRLDRIEAWAKFALKNGGPEDKFEVVLALVNVAKAAEPIAESVPRGLAVGKDELWALVEAYEALAVLDKDPSL